MKKLKKQTSRKKKIIKKNKKWENRNKTNWKKNNRKKNTFHNRGSPQHQDTQLGSENLPQ